MVACTYLRELDREEAIPERANDPTFKATAEMSHWLSHPNEFGRIPDELELFDTREIFWPPTNDRRQVWLFKYRYLPEEPGGESEVGIGMVGSITFVLFGEATDNLSPEDVYALHCCWELQFKDDPRAPEERSIEIGRQILADSANESVE